MARIAPQRSTQYAELASTLAWPEWQISPAGGNISHAQPKTLGGQNYLRLDFSQPIDPESHPWLGMMAMTTDFYAFYPEIAGVPGPFLKPLDIPRPAFLPQDAVYTRRYRGKTNELFTQFLLNLAYFSSGFASNGPAPHLAVLDPLCGGGTTLFQALVYGWSAYGVDQDKTDISTSGAFLAQYLRSQRMRFRQDEDRLRGLGRRYRFELDPKGSDPRRCVLAQADTAAVARALDHPKIHLIVADLPYGVQHKGALADLLQNGLPAWMPLLRPGGALALAWESSRFPRQEMLDLLGSHPGLTPLTDPPYDQLAHQVDRAIKQRDVVVARKP